MGKKAPTAKMSRAYLTALGYTCVGVETRIPGTYRSRDLCGCDMLAMAPAEPLTLVQFTTRDHGNMKYRIEKLAHLEDAIAWVRSGGRILVHGWMRPNRSRKSWEVDEVELVIRPYDHVGTEFYLVQRATAPSHPTGIVQRTHTAAGKAVADG